MLPLEKLLTWTVGPLRLSQGAGTEEACLIDILASRTNDEIKAINAFYKKRERGPAQDRVPDLGLIYHLRSGGASGLCMTSDIVHLVTVGKCNDVRSDLSLCS